MRIIQNVRFGAKKRINSAVLSTSANHLKEKAVNTCVAVKDLYVLEERKQNASCLNKVQKNHNFGQYSHEKS